MNIEPPKDIKGREIPLDTEVLYDRYGGKNNVRLFAYFANTDTWRVKFTGSTSYFAASDMCLDGPDSWEKLEEDLSRAAGKTCAGTCAYFDTDPVICDRCTIGDISACDSAAMRDILSRIRKLRGEGE